MKKKLITWICPCKFGRRGSWSHMQLIKYIYYELVLFSYFEINQPFIYIYIHTHTHIHLPILIFFLRKNNLKFGICTTINCKYLRWKRETMKKIAITYNVVNILIASIFFPPRYIILCENKYTVKNPIRLFWSSSFRNHKGIKSKRIKI